MNRLENWIVLSGEGDYCRQGVLYVWNLKCVVGKLGEKWWGIYHADVAWTWPKVPD